MTDLDDFESENYKYYSTDINQLKLFNWKQILLFIGNVSMGDEEKIKNLIHELGFSENVLIYGNYATPTRNLYAGFFDFREYESSMYLLKEKLSKNFYDNNIGMVDFFLIEATQTNMLKSMWHDGYY